MAKLFIVDDDLPTSDFLRAFFTKKGYEVSVANDGVTALERFADERPDIVLLDIGMPSMSGLEVLKRVKQEYPSTHVVMMTAVAEKSVMLQAKELGASNYIIKPFSLEYLEKEVLPSLLDQLP